MMELGRLLQLQQVGAELYGQDTDFLSSPGMDTSEEGRNPLISLGIWIKQGEQCGE